jgi:hypothetical protein
MGITAREGSKKKPELSRECRYTTGAYHGSALVITLVFIVLVAATILAFFSQTRSTLLITRSEPTRVAQELLTQSAVEAIISDLRLEMLAGSETDAQRTDFGTLAPMTVRQRWAMVPARVISTQVPAAGFETLVKQSLSGQSFYPGSNPSSAYAAQGPATTAGSQRASTVNTGVESPNGRILSAKRWDSIGLTQSTLPDTALPDWIYVTRDGVPENAQTLQGSAVSDPSTGNTGYVTGRYAYNIYNVGGLLNVNAAGSPQSLSSQASRKGSLAWADLRAIGLTSDQIGQLIDFRNVHSKDSADYAGLVNGQAELAGFLKPLKINSNYDGFFYTRGDLLHFFLNLFNCNSVSDCTTGQRSILANITQDLYFLTAPSYAPDPGRAKIMAAGAGGNDSQGKDDQINPNPNTTTFTVASDNEFTRLRYDSSGNPAREVSARKGEPFLNSRFPLSRLSLLSNTATAAASSPIQRYFGLTRTSASGPWVYEHGGNGTILTLAQVRALTPPREPDMAELLKAAIIAGSLGKSAGAMTAGGATADNRDQNLDAQVIQIFANLIDQSDADGYPTEIRLGGTSYYGVENLPYLTRIKTFLVRLLPDSTADDANQPYELAFLPEIWNPHDLSPPSASPTQIRVVADTRIPGLDEPTLYPVRVLQNNSGSNWVAVLNTGFSPNSNFITLDSTALASKEPVLLKTGFPASANETPNPGGIHTSSFNVPYATGPIGFQIYTDNTYPGIIFALEYLGPDGNWHRYFERPFIRSADATAGGSAAARGRSSSSYYPQQNNCRTVVPDPRTDRFSSYRIQELENAANAYVDGASLRPDQRSGYGFVYSSARPLSPDITRGWFLGNANPASNTAAQAIGTILQNTSLSSTRYADADGVLRPGDGALASGNGQEGQMYWPGNLASRPLVLNRLFRSVGEMGYAFRGTPCRTLDFFSIASGDAPLLDFFSVNEVPDDSITGGRIAINSSNVNTLIALLRGALADEGSTGATITDSRAENAAESLINLIKDPGTGGGPLLNRSELVTRWLGDQSRLPLGSDAERIKRQREVFIRALADVVETRTWNLLIDLIAQTGRIPTGKTNLDQFLVESERHVWVHLSIDRLTGRILHLNQEPAND